MNQSPTTLTKKSIQFILNTIISLKERVLKSEFNRNVLILSGGTVIAQAIPILISPVLTRLYTPADFGTLALFVSITSIVGVISCGRYELAIMLPERDEEAINVAAVALLFNTAISLLFFLIILLFNQPLLKILKAESLSFWIYFAPLTVFFMGLFNILNYTNNRFKLYKDIAKSNIYKSIAGAIIQLILGFLKSGVTGLITGQIASQTVANWRLWKNIESKNILKSIDKTQMKQMASRYHKFPKYSMGAGLMNVAAYQVTNILIGAFYGQTALGHYYLAQRILGLPTTFIGSSISQVFFQKANEEKIKTGMAINTFNSTLKKLILISVPIFTIIFVFVKPLFPYIFGEKWKEVGLYAMILTPMFAIRFVSSTLSLSYIVFEKLRYDIYVNIFLLLTPCLLIIIFKSFLNFILYYSISMAILYLSFIFIYKMLCKKIL